MKHILFLAAIAMVLASCNMGDQTAANNAALAAKNKAANQRFYDEVFNKHNLAMIDTLVAADVVDHTPDPGYTGNIAGMKKSFGDFFTAFPDLQCKVNFTVAEGDFVTTHSTMTGTNTGALMGMPASGKKIAVDGIDIIRLKDGKAVEHWGYYDIRKMMTQMGMMPASNDSTMAKAEEKK